MYAIQLNFRGNQGHVAQCGSQWLPGGGDGVKCSFKSLLSNGD